MQNAFDPLTGLATTRQAGTGGQQGTPARDHERQGHELRLRCQRQHDEPHPWSSYNLPTTINAPTGTSAQFAYTPDRARWRQISTYAGGTETTIYVGGLLEKLTTSAGTRWKHLIPTPSNA